MTFIYGVAALGKYSGNHVVELLMDDLKNNTVFNNGCRIKMNTSYTPKTS